MTTPTNSEALPLTNCSASWLEKLGAFQITINGIELKGWIPDFIDGGTHKIYLDENECLQISSAFCDAARLIMQNKQNDKRLASADEKLTNHEK